MKKFIKILFKIFKYALLTVFLFSTVVFVWQISKKVPVEGDWKEQLQVLSTAEFNGDMVTVRNIRNFQYDENEKVTLPLYYDKTYDLSKLKKVWFVTEPFEPGSPFAHTLLSFQFGDDSFLAITIEARLKKGESYSLINGTLHTFPLMYIAADERDVIFVRTNTRKDEVYVYPLKANQVDGRKLLVDMLERMNTIAKSPTWYNTFYANCTSSIAHHVNKIWPGLLPRFDWQVVFTNYADKMALDRGLLDTNLTIEEARKKYYISDISRKAGRVENYSALIRKDFGVK